MNAVADLLDCLSAEADEVGHFIALLEAEAAALTESDSTDDLIGTTEAKQVSANRLGELSRRRHGLAVQLGGSGGDYAATQQVAERHPDVAEAWEELLALAEHARNLNQRNGVLIDTHLRHTQMSLDMLRSVAGMGDVYDASGRAQPINAGKTIATG